MLRLQENELSFHGDELAILPKSARPKAQAIDNNLFAQIRKLLRRLEVYFDHWNSCGSQISAQSI